MKNSTKRLAFPCSDPAEQNRHFVLALPPEGQNDGFRRKPVSNRFAKVIFLLSTIFLCAFSAAAQQPLYIVNGIETEDISSIPPDDIEYSEMLPADEENIAKYGEKASNGVMLVTLRYDQPAIFSESESFNSYIAGQVKWTADEPAARVVLRYTVTTDGRAVITTELESTDSRLKRRIVKAVEEAPSWTPAMKDGAPVESEGVLHILLPEGKPMPRQAELVWR